MRRAVVMSVFLAGGVLAAAGSPGWPWVCAVGVMLLAALALRRPGAFPVGVVWACAGLVSGAAIWHVYELHVHDGWGSALPSAPDQSVSAAFTVENFVQASDEGARFFARLTGSHGARILVHARPGLAESLRPGDGVLAWGNLALPRPSCNRDAFDYTQWLAAQRVRGVFRMEHFARLPSLAPAGGVLVRVRRALCGFRQSVEDALSAPVISGTGSGLLKALMLGQQSAVDYPTRQLYSQTGTAHVLAVSGMHLGCLALMVYWVTAPLCLLAGRRGAAGALLTVRYALVVAVCGLYLVLSGESLACARAFVMVVGLAAARVARRDFDAWTWLAVSCLVLVSARPAAVFDAGFQLSLASVASIAAASQLSRWSAVYAPIRVEERPGWLRTIGKALAGTLGATAAATIATLPFAWWHFGAIPLASLPANMIAVPASSFVCLPGVLLHSLGLRLVPVLGDGLLQLLGAALDLTNGSLDLCLSLLPPLRPAWPGVGLAGLGAFLLFAAVFWAGNWRARLLLTAIPMALWLAPRDAPSESAHFFHAGEGDAALIRTTCGKTYLVDGGRNATAGRAVAARLRREGIREIDGMFLSHGHADHWAGVAQAEGFARVRAILSTVSPLSLDAAGRLVSAHGDRETRRLALAAGDTVDLCGGTVRVLWPPGVSAKRGENDNSLVLLFELESMDLLLMGDVQSLDTLAFLRDRSLVQPRKRVLRVVKLPHHGRRSAAFLAALLALDADLWVVPSDGFLAWREALLAFGFERLALGNLVITGQDGAVTVGKDRNHNFFGDIEYCK